MNPVYLGQRLSPRELDVLHRIADGKSNPAMARDMYLSYGTVKTHVQNLFGKLGARDRAHAVYLGFAHGYLRVDDFGGGQ